MCTLTILKSENGSHIFMNRDERHDREPEHPPQILDKPHGIVGPLDPVSGGTWMACNAKGFWGCLLNGYFEEQGASINATKSRGGILLELLKAEDPIAAMKHFDPSGYASFRLVLGSKDHHQLYVWDGRAYGLQSFHAEHKGRAFFLTSSSWQQDEVIELRKSLFEDWASKQTHFDDLPAFQFSQDPSPESAPLMHRSYSRTQSITKLNITSLAPEMSYWRISDTDQAGKSPDFQLFEG